MRVHSRGGRAPTRRWWMLREGSMPCARFYAGEFRVQYVTNATWPTYSAGAALYVSGSLSFKMDTSNSSQPGRSHRPIFRDRSIIAAQSVCSDFGFKYLFMEMDVRTAIAWLFPRIPHRPLPSSIRLFRSPFFAAPDCFCRYQSCSSISTFPGNGFSHVRAIAWI